jgi:hypothetical protein
MHPPKSSFDAAELHGCGEVSSEDSISSTFGRTAAAITHSKQRNIHLSRLLSDKQEAVSVQCRQ